MKTLFLIANNLVIGDITYLQKGPIDEKREKRVLSIEGEKAALKLAKIRGLDCVSKIYTSGYASAIGTAKYLAKRLNISVNVLSDLNERKIGRFPDGLKLSYFKDSQEHDFNYHLPEGESINDTKERLTKVINKILKEEEEVSAIFTHQTAINSYLMNFCETSYNLDDHLVLNYNDNVVSNFNSLIIYKLVYNDKNELIDIKTF